MRDKPMVSIITPCYDSEKWVGRYLTSILNQTYTNIELIVINDGSRDNTESIVLSYKGRFEAKGLTFVYQYQENKGLGGAVNTALKLVRGKYFTWCDSDNFYTDDYVEKNVGFFEEHPEFDIVRCDGTIVSDADIGKPIQLMSKGNRDKYCPKLFLNALEARNFHFGCAMLKTEAFDKINPAREIYPSREGQNWQLLLPMLYHYRSGYIDRPMFYFVIRKDSISNRSSQKGRKEKTDQIDEYAKILTATLTTMRLDESERKKYLDIVSKKYARIKMSLANLYRDVPLLESQYALMKQNHWATPKDTLKYFIGRYFIGTVFYKLYRGFRYPAHTGKSMKGKKTVRGSGSGAGERISVKKKRDCTGCHACFSICPEKCIEMPADREGFLYPQADASRCIHCGLCQKACPMIHKAENSNPPYAYAAYNKDDGIREKSSSGGIFTLLAENILQKGGAVFGAGFDGRFNVVHSFVETSEELDRFRGSKYVQSAVGHTYEQAKAFLEQGRLVLFSGTPCQIAGLKSYLKRDYVNLFCQDLICHGVPSPKVWKKYVDYRQRQAHSPVKSITFRKKTEGWKRFSVSFTFENGTEYESCHQEDLMMRAFLSNLCLRPSCYHCPFKSNNRQSDITLADFWGIQHILPAMEDDNKGISLVLINSKKGKELFESIKNDIVCQPVDVDDSLKYNPAADDPAKRNKGRYSFFKYLDTYEFDKLIDRCSYSPLMKLKKYIKRRIIH